MNNLMTNTNTMMNQFEKNLDARGWRGSAALMACRRKILFFAAVFTFMLIAASDLSAHNVGDYRAAGAGPSAWTTLASWQRWDGDSWETPTVGEGYPGQNPGTGDVLIQTGHAITTVALTTQPMGTVTVAGTLTFVGNGITVSLNTQILNIPSGGTVRFTNQSTLALP